MKVFDDMDKEQADMYRWVRRSMNESMFWQLTGQVLTDNMPVLDIDKALREAYLQDRAQEFAIRGVEASKVKVGLLPPSLGMALITYTNAVTNGALFEEGLSGETHGDKDREVVKAFQALCEEMAKLAK